jgi:hypothetical protein
MTKESSIEKRIYQHEAVMQKIAANYPKNSEEETALRLATLAYFFIVCHYDDKFQHYLENMSKPPTAADKKFLKKIGIEGDDSDHQNESRTMRS